jgi:hypothetical protein
MERHGDLHRRHDGQCGRRKLRRQFLDAEPESDDQQRRSWHGRALDRDWPLFDLLVGTSYSDWLSGIGDDQLQHKPELERGHSPRRMQCEL